MVRDREHLVEARSNMGATITMAYNGKLSTEDADEIVGYVLDHVGLSYEFGFAVVPIIDTPYRKAMLASSRKPPGVPAL